ncbi:hypothetical protein Q7P37_009892 [Cladosporium fusiforme]
MLASDFETVSFVVTCGMAFVLVQRAIPGVTYLDITAVCSLLRRAKSLTTFSDDLKLTLDGPLELAIGAIRRWNMMSSLANDTAPSQDESPDDANTRNLDVTSRWLWLKLKRVLVKTFLNFLRRRTNVIRFYRLGPNALRGRLPKVSVHFTPTLFAAGYIQLHSFPSVDSACFRLFSCETLRRIIPSVQGLTIAEYEAIITGYGGCISVFSTILECSQVVFSTSSSAIKLSVITSARSNNRVATPANPFCSCDPTPTNDHVGLTRQHCVAPVIAVNEADRSSAFS